MRTHTLAPSILPLLEAPAEGFFWNLPEFGRHIQFDVLHGCETHPLEAHFQSREEPKVARSEVQRVRWLGDDRNDFLGEELLHNKQNVAWFVIVIQTPLSLPLVTPFPPYCIAQAFLPSSAGVWHCLKRNILKKTYEPLENNCQLYCKEMWKRNIKWAGLARAQKNMCLKDKCWKVLDVFSQNFLSVICGAWEEGVECKRHDGSTNSLLRF